MSSTIQTSTHLANTEVTGIRFLWLDVTNPLLEEQQKIQADR